MCKSAVDSGLAVMGRACDRVMGTHGGACGRWEVGFGRNGGARGPLFAHGCTSFVAKSRFFEKWR
eukprot:7164303-Prymnesium_polylepis.1